ncbi:hypothetical protein [Mycobacterium sp.]|uniref:hypothetical protein n=1 Tax=Mycobacterium sp. TaxID=1785 RepID=UPI002623DD6D|nr:hypothetical protein [Mycobacterium sp.]
MSAYYIVEHATRGCYQEWVDWPLVEQRTGRPRFAWSKPRTAAARFTSVQAARAIVDRCAACGVHGCYVLGNPGKRGDGWHDVMTEASE